MSTSSQFRTSADTGTEFVAKMLQAIDQEFREQPLYVFNRGPHNRHLMPVVKDRGGIAFACPTDHCRRWLTSQGLWKGPGFAIAYNVPPIDFTPGTYLGTALRLAASHLAAGDSTGDFAFLRIALHLHVRANTWLATQGEKAVSRESVIPTNWFSLEKADAFAKLLADEIAKNGKNALRSILTQKPPEDFMDLCNMIAARRSGGEVPFPVRYEATPKLWGATSFTLVKE